MSQTFLALGALLAAVAVGLGAFGAHGLRGRLPAERQNSFETGVRYQIYHALALIAVGLSGAVVPGSLLLTAAGWLFLAGILLFSGSIYGLVLGGPRWLGPITPLGGLALIAGWVLLALGMM